jgi:hypothetical protein
LRREATGNFASGLRELPLALPQFPSKVDESNKQLVGEVLAPIAPAPGDRQIIDHE